jgi:hypothetical protein
VSPVVNPLAASVAAIWMAALATVAVAAHERTVPARMHEDPPPHVAYVETPPPPSHPVMTATAEAEKQAVGVCDYGDSIGPCWCFYDGYNDLWDIAVGMPKEYRCSSAEQYAVSVQTYGRPRGVIVGFR